MKQLFRPRLVFLFLMLVFTGIAFPSWAQPNDSLPNRSAQSPKALISNLKAALAKRVDSPQTVDSLLTAARQLAYLPGQVVALCQLAAIRVQRQQPQESTALLQEAERIAGQSRDLRETGWAMSQVGKIRGVNSRLMSSFSAALTPVMDALGKSLGNGVAIAGKVDGSFPFEDYDPREKRSPGRHSFQPSIQIPTFDPRLIHHGRLKPDFVDRWLDTIIHSDNSNPQVVRQLVARKKIRDSSQVWSKAFAQEGDYAKAYKYFLQYTAYKDSLTTEATSRRLASLTYKQNLLKKEAQIQLLTKDRQLREQASNRQRQYVFVLIGCLALLAAVALILSRNNRAKQLANRQLNEQKEALQQTLAQLKITQTQLIQSEKMASLGELTAGIAHEIQNPLNFVNNFSEVSTELVSELIEIRQSAQRDDELEDELLGDVQQNLEKIHLHGHRASSIIKGMLEHARTSTGQKELTDLNTLADEYAQLAYHGIQVKDKSFEAKLTFVPDLMLKQTMVAPQEVGRVLFNIINNAFYAVHERQQREGPDYHPEVSIKTSQDAGQITIQIRDNGTGVPESIKEKVFQPFFTTKPTGQGTGLGLSLSYDIITKGHGGSLALESEEGKFTEFIITLPITT